MFRCAIDVINDVVRWDLTLTTEYPPDTYSCDNHPEGSKLELRKTDGQQDWLTFQRVALVLDELLDAAASLTDLKMYTGSFEVWIPPHNPRQKVLDGTWQAPPEGSTRVHPIAVD